MSKPLPAAEFRRLVNELIDEFMHGVPKEYFSQRMMDACTEVLASSPVTLEEADAEEAARRIVIDWRGISADDKVCGKCGGSGVRVYGSTSTWHGGIGGQQLTSDICDRCWGSGAENRPWLDLRKHSRAIAEVQKGGA